MRNISDRATLESLRARTDRDLIAMIEKALDRGFELLDRHANGAPIKPHKAHAQRAHAEAVKLLPVVHGLSDFERRRLEGKLAELRSALDGASCGPETESQRAVTAHDRLR